MGKYSHVKPGESVTFSNGATAVKQPNGQFKIKSGPTKPRRKTTKPRRKTTKPRRKTTTKRRTRN